MSHSNTGLLGEGVLALWLDVIAGQIVETDQWYIDEHLPERVDIGKYFRARRYESTDTSSPAYFSLFEASTPEALTSSGYLSLVTKISEQSRRIRSGFRNVTRNTFRVKSSVGRGTGGLMTCLLLEPLPARGADSKDEFPLLRQLLQRSRITGVHWLEEAPEIRKEMDAHRAVGQEDARVHTVLLVEGTHQTDIDLALKELCTEDRLSSLGLKAITCAPYRLLYEVR